MDLLDRLPKRDASGVGVFDIERTTHWLLSRQTLDFVDEADSDDEDSPEPGDIRWVGFNGRCNKIADTCYAWWVGGALAVSDHSFNLNIV